MIDVARTKRETALMRWPHVIPAVLAGLTLGLCTFRAAEACELKRYTECANAQLAGADLRDKWIFRSNFTRANLRGANLQGLVLELNDFSNADLSEANLADTFLAGANLRGANLQGADLRRAFLFRSFAEGANFAGARLDGARWITGVICGPDSVGECRPLPVNAPLPVWDPQWQATPASISSIPSTGSIKLTNDVVATVTQVLPADPMRAKPTEGASFTGYSFVPRSQTSVVNVRVSTGVFSEKGNTAVLAVFVNRQVPPVKLVSKLIRAGVREQIDFEFRVPANGASILIFDFRIGPGLPGSITFNGQEGKPPDYQPATVVLTDEDNR